MQVEHKTRIVKWSSKLPCDYGDAYIPVRGTKTVAGNTAAAPVRNNKQVILKNCDPFADCMIEINNIQVDNAKFFDVVMSMHHLLECSKSYSKTFQRLWQYCRDEPNNTTIDF